MTCPHGYSRGDFCPRCSCWPAAALLAMLLTGCLHSDGQPTIGNLESCEVDLEAKRASMTAIEAAAKMLCGSEAGQSSALRGLCVLAPAVEWIAGVVKNVDPADCETARHAVAAVEHCEQAYEHAKHVVQRAKEVGGDGAVDDGQVDNPPMGPGDPGPDPVPVRASPPPAEQAQDGVVPPPQGAAPDAAARPQAPSVGAGAGSGARPQEAAGQAEEPAQEGATP